MAQPVVYLEKVLCALQKNCVQLSADEDSYIEIDRQIDVNIQIDRYKYIDIPIYLYLLSHFILSDPVYPY